MKINEIFYSIQGESAWTGYPTVFVRLQGCNMECTYCDTKYAQKKGGKEMTPEEVAEEIRKYPASYICFTGGEPLLQQDEIIKVIRKLADPYTAFSIETNGTIVPSQHFRIAQVPIENMRFVYDFKLPSAFKRRKDYEKYKENFLVNIVPATVGRYIEVKFVTNAHVDDLDEIMHIAKFIPHICMSISPQWGKVDLRDLVNWIKENLPKVRMQLQMHKIIWEPEERGV